MNYLMYPRILFSGLVSHWPAFRKFFAYTVLLSASSLACASGLTPAQLQQLQQMTPEQRAALAQLVSDSSGNAAISSGNTLNASGSEQGSVMQPRTVFPGRLTGSYSSQANAAQSANQGKMTYEIKSLSFEQPKVNSSVEILPPDDERVKEPAREAQPAQMTPEKAEVRRAFEEFVSDSKSLKVSTENLQQFGYDLFAGEPGSFAPVTDVPVPSDYVLGPGDEIKVQLFGKDARELVLTVDRQGVVAFPEIGPIPLAGLDFSTAKASLIEQIKQKLLGVSVSITMGQLRSIRVFALGDVYRPGSYTVSGLATLSHALFSSGGVKTIGSLRNIELKRDGRHVGNIDLYDFLLKGDTSKDVRLLPGDVVFVPAIGKTVGIAGEVVRPAIYELKGERTVGDMLKLAGGLLPSAYTSKALIERINPRGDKEVVNVGLAGIGLATPVQNGDIIKVFPVTEFESNQVLLIGNVKRPGQYAWHKNMRVLDLIQSKDDLLPESLMEYGIIEREAEDNREPVMIRFRLGELMGQGENAAEYNVELRSRDRVYVFHRANFREQPKVEVAGSVQSPGQYEFKRNMHLVDLVLSAGGLLRDTDSGDVEIYRTDAVTRDVTLLKTNLARAMNGDKEHDIALQDFDRVVIHSIYEHKLREEVSVMGEVHHPATVPLSQGMRLTDLLFAAGNVTESAYLGKGEVTRYKVVGSERRVVDHIEIDLSAALRGEEVSNILLEPYDVLMVRRLSNWREAEQITVQGEVMHPGVYPVEDGEKLSSLLQRVGGFTKDAFLPAAVFVRESVREEQQKQLDDLVKRMENEIIQLDSPTASIRDPSLRAQTQAGMETSRRLLAQLKTVRATGRMVIELADIAKLKDKFYDIRLKGGDKLIVPKRPDEVLVLGEVYNQTALLFKPGLDRDDYVRQAGPTRMADTDAIYVVRANGMVDTSSNRGWLSTSNSAIGPGDTVVVPLQTDHVNVLDLALDWSRAMMQIGTSAAAMKAIGVFK